MDQAKMNVGIKAVDFVKDGMTVGLGTGSTAYYFIDELGRRLRKGELKDIQAVATSVRSQDQAEQLGIRVINIDMVDRIDLLVDGADEATTTFWGIKGGGGALLYEKIVAVASNRIIWVVTEDKLVNTLGQFPLPIEVVPFGSFRLMNEFRRMGMSPTFRRRENDTLFTTDAGNYIIDLHLNAIPNPHQLALELDRTVGVIEHGLFLDMADTILVGRQDGTIDAYYLRPELGSQ